jgi:hypothetical protein
MAFSIILKSNLNNLRSGENVEGKSRRRKPEADRGGSRGLDG